MRALEHMRISYINRQWHIFLLSVAAWCAIPATMLLAASYRSEAASNDYAIWAAIFSILLACTSQVLGIRSEFTDQQWLGKLGVSLGRFYLLIVGISLVASLIYWLTL